MLAERNEKAIYLDPVFLRQLRLELAPNLIGAARSDIAPPHGDTCDVDIDADPLLPRRYSESEVRALLAHAVERHQHFSVGRQLAAEMLHRGGGERPDLLRFRLVKGARRNQPVDLTLAHPRHRRRVGRRLEQANRSRKTHLISRANGDDARHKLLEYRGEPTRPQVEHRGVREAGDFLSDAADHDVYIERLLSHRSSRCGAANRADALDPHGTVKKEEFSASPDPRP